MAEALVSKEAIEVLHLIKDLPKRWCVESCSARFRCPRLATRQSVGGHLLTSQCCQSTAIRKTFRGVHPGSMQQPVTRNFHLEFHDKAAAGWTTDTSTSFNPPHEPLPTFDFRWWGGSCISWNNSNFKHEGHLRTPRSNASDSHAWSMPET